MNRASITLPASERLPDRKEELKMADILFRGLAETRQLRLRQIWIAPEDLLRRSTEE
jgi:hypothetical protein